MKNYLSLQYKKVEFGETTLVYLGHIKKSQVQRLIDFVTNNHQIREFGYSLEDEWRDFYKLKLTLEAFSLQEHWVIDDVNTYVVVLNRELRTMEYRSDLVDKTVKTLLENHKKMLESVDFTTPFLGHLSIPTTPYQTSVEFQKQKLNFLPTKIIFNEEKGKTTLLFGEVGRYEVFSSVAKNVSEYGYLLGFLIAYYKYIKTTEYLYPKQIQELIQRLFKVSLDGHLFVGIIIDFLFDKGLSENQTMKLFNEFEDAYKIDGSRTITIRKGNDIEHDIVIEVIGNKRQNKVEQDIKDIEKAVEDGSLVVNKEVKNNKKKEVKKK